MEQQLNESVPSFTLGEGDDISQQLRSPEFGIKVLRSVPLLQAFKDEQLLQLYKVAEHRTIQAQSYAVLEGENSRGLFILMSGTVSVYKNEQTSGQMHRLAMLEAVAHFGEFSLFDDAPRSATVAAETFCHLLHIDALDFQRFLDGLTETMRMNFYRICAQEICGRFRNLNADYINAQQLLWKHALRLSDDQVG